MASVALSIGPVDAGRKMTLGEFEEAQEEPGYRYELARGVLEVTQIPGEQHGNIVWFFLGRIRDWEREHPRVIARAGGGNDFRLWLPGMESARHPDIGVSKGARRDPRRHLRPNLVMEAVSDGAEAHDRDYVTKRVEYLAYGVDEYWIIDRFTRQIVVLIRDGDVWIEHIFKDGQIAQGLALPGFLIPVSEVWIAAQAEIEDD